MPKKQQKGLGRGLGALLPESELPAAGSIEIGIGEIDPNPDQPRRHFDAESITSLAQSIREQGVLQPVLVVESGNGRYRLVAGERRWRAAREAGLDKVPAIVRELDETQEREIALIENLQREDLDPIEEAQGVQALMVSCGYTQEQAAERLGCSRPAVANLLRLLTLPKEVQELVTDGLLSAGHARVLAGLPDADKQRSFAQLVIDKGLSVRQLEELVKEVPAVPKQEKKKEHVLPPELKELETSIREVMGVKATLTGTVKKGRIVLQYSSREELESLYEQINRLVQG